MGAVSASQSGWRKPAVVLLILLVLFVTLHWFLPLRTAIQIGGDEGFELAKATLCLKGYKLYSDVWNDQPPLHTFLITQALKHISSSVALPRLITICFAIFLLGAMFLMCLRISGILTATITTLMLITSPGFLALSSSCMLEIPALAPAVAALCVLSVGPAGRRWVEVGSGMLFGMSLLTKLVPAMLLPLAAILLLSRAQKWRANGPATHSSLRKELPLSLLVFLASAAATFVVLDWIIDGGAFLLHFRQTWTSHFAAAKSLEYGSPNDHPFDWSILLKNWDTTLPAIVGITLLLRRIRDSRNSKSSATWQQLLPVFWLVLVLLVFGFHKPWWPYYYVHIAIPLCWCAGNGIAFLFERPRTKAALAVIALYALCTLPWAAARVWLQIKQTRDLPQTYNTVVLDEIKRYRQLTQWLYAEEPIYSFHTGIPLPPPLAVVMLKRLWSGDMTNARIAAELETFKPGVILLKNDGHIAPFRNLLNSEYRLVYEEADHRLYAYKPLIRKAQQAE